MSGKVSMMLGAFAFESIGFGYDGLSAKLNTQWAEIDVAQTMNQQQWTGPSSEEVTIKGVLFPDELGGQSSLEGIKAAAKAGRPMMLVSGDNSLGTIHGQYTVHGIDEDQSYHTAYGTPRRNAYSITLKKYERTAAPAGATSFLSLFG